MTSPRLLLPLAAMAFALALGVAPAAAQQANAPDTSATVYLGTGGVTGVYFPAGGAVCRLINRDRSVHGVRCVLESTGGSLANLALLKETEVDFALVASDWQARAYGGEGQFEGDAKMEALRSVLSLHAEPLTILVKADSEVQRFTDLQGKTVNIGRPNTGRRVTMEAALTAHDMDVDDLGQAATLDGNAVAPALCNGEIDAAVEAIGHPAQAIKDISDRCAVRFIPVSGSAIDALIDAQPFYTKASIPAGTYPGQTEPVDSFGVRATLVTVDAMPERVVYVVAKAVLGQVDALKRLHPALGTLNAVEMSSVGLIAPVHPGAQQAIDELQASLAEGDSPTDDAAPSTEAAAEAVAADGADVTP